MCGVCGGKGGATPAAQVLQCARAEELEGWIRKAEWKGGGEVEREGKRREGQSVWGSREERVHETLEAQSKGEPRTWRNHMPGGTWWYTPTVIVEGKQKREKMIEGCKRRCCTVSCRTQQMNGKYQVNTELRRDKKVPYQNMPDALHFQKTHVTKHTNAPKGKARTATAPHNKLQPFW